MDIAPRGVRNPKPTPGSPAGGTGARKRSPPPHLSVKSGGWAFGPSRGNPGQPLKGPAQTRSLATLTWSPGGGTVIRGVSEAYGVQTEVCYFRARTGGSHNFSCVGVLSLCAASRWRHLACFKPSPTWENLNLIGLVSAPPSWDPAPSNSPNGGGTFQPT